VSLRLFPVLAAILLFGALSAADLTITFESSKKGMGSAAKPGTEIHYYTSSFLLTRAVDARQDVLVDFQQGINYSINHPKRTIGKISFDDALAAMDAMADRMPAAANPFLASMFGDPSQVNVSRLGEEQIAGRTCQAWRITVGKLTMEVAADPSLKPPMPEGAYTRMLRSRAAQSAQPGPMGATFKRLYEEMAKVKGIPLRTHMTGMMGMDVSTLATRIETGPVPGATFVLPAGYKEEDLGKKLREQMAKGR